MHRFYINSKLYVGEMYQPEKDFINHYRALRIKNNSTIILFNGDSYEYEAEVIERDRKDMYCKIISKNKKEITSDIEVELLISLIANDKMDLVIQKAVELGIKTITPIITKRSQKIHIDKIENKLVRWQKIVISSCEQCGSNILPIVTSAKNFADTIKEKFYGTRIILSTSDNKTQWKLPQKAIKVQLLIGPEGGFDQHEMDHAINNDFIPIKLGRLILRSETAAIVGLTFINILFNNWH